MARVAFKMRLKPGMAEIYKQKHDEIWPELVELLHASGVRNYSIYRSELDLFAYLETDVPFHPGVTPDPLPDVQRRWWEMMAPYMETNDDSSPKVWPVEDMFYMP